MGNSISKRLQKIEKNISLPLQNGYTELEFKKLVNDIFIHKYISTYVCYDYNPYVYEILDGILDHECHQIGVLSQFVININTPLEISTKLIDSIKSCKENKLTSIIIITNAVCVSNYVIDYFTMNNIHCIPICRDTLLNITNKLCNRS